MEGGVGASANEFKTFWSIILKNPFILQLAFSAGVGGLLFGYDTGNSTSTFFLYRTWHCSQSRRVFNARIHSIMFYQLSALNLLKKF